MFHTIDQIKRANQQHGHYFFERDTMRFFDSRILEGVIAGRYFITSEANHGLGIRRMYTVREVMSNGAINTVSEFQQYATASAARKAARALPADYSQYLASSMIESLTGPHAESFSKMRPVKWAHYFGAPIDDVRAALKVARRETRRILAEQYGPRVTA